MGTHERLVGVRVRVRVRAGAGAVLQGRCEDLGCGGRLGVDEQIDGRGEVHPVAIRRVAQLGTLVVIDEADVRLVRQQQPRHVDAAREVAARVAWLGAGLG